MASHVLVMRATPESFARVKSIIAPRCLASIMAHVCRFLEISFVLVLLVFGFIRFHSVYNCLKIKSFMFFKDILELFVRNKLIYARLNYVFMEVVFR